MSEKMTAEPKIDSMAGSAVYHHECCQICGAIYEAKGVRQGAKIVFQITGPIGGCLHEREVLKWLKRKINGQKDWRGPNWKQPNDLQQPLGAETTKEGPAFAA